MKILPNQRRVLLAALLAGAALRLMTMVYPQLWLDEIIQIQRFDHPSLEEALQDLRTETAPAPLDFILQRLFLRMLGPSEAGARLHATLCGLLSLAAIFLLAREIGRIIPAGDSGTSSQDWRSHFPAAALFLLAFFPLHVFYSGEGRPYSLFFLLTVTSFWLLLRALRLHSAAGEGRLAWAAYAGALAAALYTSYQGAVVTALQAGWAGFLWLRPRFEGKTAARAAWISQATALLLFSPWLFWTYSRTRDRFREEILSLDFFKRLIQESSGGSWPLSLLLMALGVWGFCKLYRRGARRALSLLGLWLAGGLAAVLFLDAWRGYFFAARQALFLAPAGLLAAALGWSLSRRLRRSLLVPLLIAALGAGTVILSQRKQEADWIALAALLRQQVQTGDRIAAPGIYRVLAFRYPQVNSRHIALEELLEGEDLAGRVLLIRSPYLDSETERQVERCLQRYPPIRQLRAPGFTVYVLPG
ncbi:MAG TPA: hypothetical protein VLU25_02150 [Acidobacteriota bacterium]|nr:hypothetical protein [Acidobacteriota bacterium]